jgi:hypothetical protein
MALEFKDVVLAVACPSCNAGIDRKCSSDLEFGGVALNKDGVHPDRVLLYTTLAAKPSDIHPDRAYLAAVERLPSRSSSDPVNHPTHYNASPSGVECIDVVEHMTFNVGNAVKYLWRAGLKGGSPRVEDLKKAAWYIHREIEKLTKESKQETP